MYVKSTPRKLVSALLSVELRYRLRCTINCAAPLTALRDVVMSVKMPVARK